MLDVPFTSHAPASASPCAPFSTMRLHRFIAEQLRQPSGAFGRVVMTRMLNKGNAPIIDETLASLELKPSDRFLDVGFGGGAALRIAAEQTSDGHAYGVDISDDMVATAQRRLQRLVRAGRVSVLRGDVADLPFRDGFIDKVATINTVYFWPDPPRAVTSLKRVIAPGGLLSIGFTGADKMSRYGKITEHGFRWYQPDGVAELLEAAGFLDIQTLALDGKVTQGDFVVRARRDERDERDKRDKRDKRDRRDRRDRHDGSDRAGEFGPKAD